MLVQPEPPEPSTVRVAGPWTHHEVSANGIRLHIAELGTGPIRRTAAGV